ncbi:MAG TPA: hypothetical protein VJG90_00565 [Candidatus Nanoarchaeia archaeon]|nr:hypothetical protein [Candidatus Nanoarchaeia archaeon]
MFQSLRGGSEQSLEALASAELVFLDLEHALVTKFQEQYVTRRGVTQFLGHYHAARKPFVVSSEWRREQAGQLIKELGWEEYVDFALGDSHIGLEGVKRIRNLGRGRAHFRPVPRNFLLVGVDSKLNQDSCEAYGIPLITIPEVRVGERDRFNFASLYQGEGLRGYARRARAVLAGRVF